MAIDLMTLLGMERDDGHDHLLDAHSRLNAERKDSRART